jgi:integrase
MMPRASTGTLESRLLADGTATFHLRFRVNGKRESMVLHERAGCACGCGGGWNERSARTELGNILARIRAEVWERSAPPPSNSMKPEGDAPGYRAYSDWWLDAKISGVIGKKPIADNTANDYRWRLGYSGSFFADTPVSEIDRGLSLAFKASLLEQAREQRQLLEAGADLRDRRGRRLVPLSLASIKMILNTFAAILDEAIEDGYRDDNPGHSRRMQIEVPKPKRTFLELDELAALLDAARDQDQPLPTLVGVSVKAGSTAEGVGRLAALGKKPIQIAGELGLAKSTVTYHLRRLDIHGRAYVGRRVVCELGARAGLRVSEICDLKIGRVRQHDAEGARLRIVAAKTEAGERMVELTPDLTEAIIEHLDRLRRAGLPTGPDDYLVPNTRGGRISRQRIARVISAAAGRAGELLVAKGLPLLPTTTPHTLRRTYISIALLANNFDVMWVMKQVGHADSKMTMDVYAQSQQRVKRRHGASFDRLVRNARSQLARTTIAAEAA